MSDLSAFLGSAAAFEQLDPCRRGLFCGTNAEGEDILDSGRQPLGSVRLSLGWMSRYEDILVWLDFLRQVILQGVGLVCIPSPSSSINDENVSKREIVVLTDIYIYPIKSCGSFKVKEWPLTSLSLLYDREWMIIDQNCNPLTLKRLPSLSQIRPVIDLHQHRLVLYANNHAPFTLDINQG